MTTIKERENTTLSFLKPEDRGAVMETFPPWSLTVDRWNKEGLPDDINDVTDIVNDKSCMDEVEPVDFYLNCLMTDLKVILDLTISRGYIYLYLSVISMWK